MYASGRLCEGALAPASQETLVGPAAASGSIRRRKHSWGVRGTGQASPGKQLHRDYCVLVWGSGPGKHSMRQFHHSSAASSGCHAQYAVRLEFKELTWSSQVHTAWVEDEKMALGYYELCVCAATPKDVVSGRAH